MTYLLSFIALFIVQWLKLIQGQEFPFCQTNSQPYHGPKLPSLPNAFTAQVQANIVNRNYSMLLTEYYDQDANKGAIRLVFKDKTMYHIYNYNENEMMAVNTKNKTCSLQEIQTMHGHPFFGRNSSKMEGIADLFRFGSKFNETYLGNETIRGIPCDHWQACINQGHHSYLVDYYFSTPGWSMPYLPDMQVVRATINGASNMPRHQGNSSLQNVTRSFYHIYDFFSFVAGKPSADVFKVPNGLFCEGMKDRKPVPSIPPVFSLKIESVKPSLKNINHFEELYDYQRKLVMFQYYRYHNKQFGENKIVHDYTHGVLYNISGNICRGVSRLSKTNAPYDGKETKDHHFEMMSPAEMMFNGNTSNMVYTGMAKVRGIDANVWIMRHTSTYNKNVTMTSEYYFSHPSWNMRAGSLNNQSEVLLKINSYDLKGNLVNTMNILNFDGESVPLNMFSIGACFKGDRYIISLRFVGNWDDFVFDQETQFNLAVRNAIVKASNISALRVDDLKNGAGIFDIMVWFTLLDKPPIVSPDAPPENNLQQAVAALEKRVRSGVMEATWTNPMTKKPMKVYADIDYFFNSMANPTKKPTNGDKRRKRSKGVPGGAVAGVAFLMTAIGILIGLAIAHVIMKRRGSSLFQYQRQE